MKTLIFDIETSPNLAYCWDTFEQNVLSIEKERELISFAYKWEHGKTKVLSKRNHTELELLQELHKLFDEADLIVAHNGAQFDVKMANAFFIKYNLKPPSPYKVIDTLQIARSKFRFNSNRLNELGKYLGLGQKAETGGFSLWLQCLKGNNKAWKTMERYNVQDVELLEKIYHKLSPWVKTPFKELGMTCPNCGSNHLQKRGWAISKVFMSQRLQCVDCGAWSQSSNKIKHNHAVYAKAI